MESLLGGSLFFLYLFAIITVINFTEIDNKQKISVIYVLTYGIRISDAQISSKLLLWAFIVALFLYEEYWTSDGNRLKIIKSFIFKIMDFVMRMVFLYKILVYLVAIFLISSAGDKVVSDISQNFQIESDVILQIFRISSLILVFVAIHLMLIEPVELNSYDNIISKINKTPYYLMIEKECCENSIDDFIDRLSLLTDIEDRFFFCRQGYTIISFDYAKSYIREKLDEVVPEHCSIASGIYKFFHANNYKERIRLVKKICRIYYLKINALKQVLSRGFRSAMLRGNSTIEMQLFRTLIYKRGLTMGRPHNIIGLYKVIKRKIFELLFTPIFFKGLKRYLLDGGLANISYYREYILYLYVHNVISWYGGKRYMPMSKLFIVDEKQMPVYEWEKEKFFIEILGLSKQAEPWNRMFLYSDVIYEHNLSWEKLNEITLNLELDRL